ncbi:MAG: hypothetical protein ABGZ53_18280 [Fuerstiella sp.]
MATGRPPSGMDDYLEWQERLKNQKESGLSLEVFCLQEGVSKSTFYRWTRMLENGIPQTILDEKAEREEAESGEGHFLPVSIKASPVEVELPNGTKLRLPIGVGQVVLIEVIRAAGALRPWKAPNS